MSYLIFDTFAGLNNIDNPVGLDKTFLTTANNFYLDNQLNIRGDKTFSTEPEQPISVMVSGRLFKVDSSEQNVLWYSNQYDFNHFDRRNFIQFMSPIVGLESIDNNIYGWRVFIATTDGMYGFFNDLKLRRLSSHSVYKNSMRKVPSVDLPDSYAQRNDCIVFASPEGVILMDSNGATENITGKHFKFNCKISQKCTTSLDNNYYIIKFE